MRDQSIFRIFVSSTFQDLNSERESVARALHELTFPLSLFGIALIPTDLRRGATATPPLDECIAEVERSDLLLLVLGQRYGTETASGKSFTESEYHKAAELPIDCLAFIKKANAVSLDSTETLDPREVDKLKGFKENVLRDLKCDFFETAEELRGHVMRDVLAWVLEQIPSSILGTRPHIEKRFKELKSDFEIIRGPDLSEAIKLLTSSRFAKDMRRFGITSVHKAFLQDFLELGSLAPPTKVTSSIQRSCLLAEYIDRFRGSVSYYTALAEAEQLEREIDHPLYSFSLARAKAVAAYRAGRFEDAAKNLKNLLEYAWATGDYHVLGQARRVAGDFYAQKQDSWRALRWQCKSVRALVSLVDSCPHCLARALHGAGRAHACLGQCNLATDQFGKALMIARMIPDREMQSVILSDLAQHYGVHDMLKESVAAYVWTARLHRELDPDSEVGDLGFLMGDVILRRGRERIREILLKVRENAEEVVLESLKPYNLDDFTRKIKLKPSIAGDHW